MIAAPAPEDLETTKRQWAVRIVTQGTRKVRRAFTRGSGSSLSMVRKVGAYLSVGLVVLMSLAWLFAMGYVALQFFSYMMAMNPVLFWLIIVGFFVQFGSSRFLLRKVNSWLREESADLAPA